MNLCPILTEDYNNLSTTRNLRSSSPIRLLRGVGHVLMDGDDNNNTLNKLFHTKSFESAFIKLSWLLIRLLNVKQTPSRNTVAHYRHHNRVPTFLLQLTSIYPAGTAVGLPVKSSSSFILRN